MGEYAEYHIKTPGLFDPVCEPLFESGGEFEYYVFHDESGTFDAIPGFFIHGFLIVPKREIQRISDTNMRIREKFDFWSTFHFVSGNRAVRAYLDAYFNSLFRFSYYTALAVNKSSESYNKHVFIRPFLAYNRFALMGLLSAFRYRFARCVFSKLIIDILAEKRKVPRGDNYQTYLPKRFFDTFVNRTYKRTDISPKIEVGCIVTQLDMRVGFGDRAEQDQPYFACLELTDVLTSAVGQAFNRTSATGKKLRMGEEIAKVVLDTEKPPWAQVFDLFKRFDVWGFPNERNGIYDSLYPVLSKKTELTGPLVFG